MKNVAVVMGAGASKPFGYLLTREIFPHIKNELNSGNLFRNDVRTNMESHNEECREELKDYFNALLPGSSVKSLDLPKWINNEDVELPLITDVLSLIDHSLLVSNTSLSSRYIKHKTTIQSNSTSSLVRFRTLLERAIISALKSPVPDADQKQRADLNTFKNWIISQAGPEGQSLGIISTNYDTALESQLFAISPEAVPLDFDFGFSWRDVTKDIIYGRPDKPNYRLYKLHGSLNWLRCELCERVYINKAYSIAHQAFRNDIDSANSCYCGHGPLRAMIVTPSLVRDVRDSNLLELWKNALELLRTSDHWIIVGYSFPPEDISIRSLFIRAYQGRWDKPRITVVQCGEDKSVISRYKMFFPDCEYYTGGLMSYVSSS